MTRIRTSVRRPAFRPITERLEDRTLPQNSAHFLFSVPVLPPTRQFTRKTDSLE